MRYWREAVDGILIDRFGRTDHGVSTRGDAVVSSRETMNQDKTPGGLLRGWVSCPCLLDDGEDVFLGHDEILFAVDLDLVAGVGGEEDLIALLDLKRGALAGV